MQFLSFYMSLSYSHLGLMAEAGHIYLHHMNWTVATKSKVIMIQQTPWTDLP